MKTSPYVIEVKDLYIQKKISWTEQELLLNKYRNADTDEKKRLDEDYYTIIKNEMSSMGKNKDLIKSNDDILFFDALFKSLYIVIIGAFLLPIKVYKNSIIKLNKENNEGADTPVLNFISNTIHAFCVLTYPIGALVLAYFTYQEMQSRYFDEFTHLMLFVYLYFYPVFIAFVGESLMILLMIYKKISSIESEIKK
tara:strand:+ start:121 stop:708 length:588 start_codon:yes stop_codon:yes gene_type:complete